MFSNYIKLAWRVLARRKFFTFITLFGISFTLMILMLITSFMQTEFGSKSPMGNQEELVIIPNIELSKEYFDSIPRIDTIMQSGLAQYDTTYTLKSVGNSNSTSLIDMDLLQNRFRDIPSIKRSTFFSTSSIFDIFVNNSKVGFRVNYSDHYFWDVFDFKFLKGRPYDAQEVESGAQVAVITEEKAIEYFGRTDVIDEMITIDAKQFKIIGIVESAKLSIGFLKTDFFIPYTNYTSNFKDFYFGDFIAIFQTDENLQVIKNEIENTAKNVPSHHNPDFDKVAVNPVTYKEMYAKTMYYQEDAEKSLSFMQSVLFGLLTLFILLPVLNLINLNVSRIMDRSSEIGVRKAFGATKGDIMIQFIFENIIQTLLGGVIGLVMVMIVIYIINDNSYLGQSKLSIDFKFFFYSILICLFFGVLSGLLPAWKISKTHIVNALKSKQL